MNKNVHTFLLIFLACKNLVSDGQICAMIRISTVLPPETDWMKLSQTEISEVCTFICILTHKIAYKFSKKTFLSF